MKRKKIVCLLVISMLCIGGCGDKNQKKEEEADFSAISSVCELATLKCYYHNVAKTEHDASGIFGKILKTGYKKIWIEYDGIVEYGIDINKVTVSEPDKDNVVKITIPEAQVLSANIDEDSISTPLTDKGFLTSISTEEKVETLNKTQSDMKGKAEKDNEMLIRAKERAKTLLEEYIKNVGESIGEDYTVEWKDAEVE